MLCYAGFKEARRSAEGWRISFLTSVRGAGSRRVRQKGSHGGNAEKEKGVRKMKWQQPFG